MHTTPRSLSYAVRSHEKNERTKNYFPPQMNKKEKKAKKDAKSAEQEVDEEMHNESMDMGLTARLGLSNEKKAAKKTKKPKADRDTSKSPKKGKKKGTWERIFRCDYASL